MPNIFSEIIVQTNIEGESDLKLTNSTENHEKLVSGNMEGKITNLDLPSTAPQKVVSALKDEEEGNTHGEIRDLPKKVLNSEKEEKVVENKREVESLPKRDPTIKNENGDREALQKNLQPEDEQKKDAAATNASETKVQSNIMKESDLNLSTSTANQEKISLGNIEDAIKSSDLPDTAPSDEEEEYSNKMKVLNNYRNFGNMYFLKNNLKKAEWAYKNGIKQATLNEIKSKMQLRSVLLAEAEFRYSRAK